MRIGSTARHQPEMRGKGEEARPVFCRMRWMNDFDAVHSHFLHRSDSLQRSLLSRMRENRDASTAMYQLNCLGDPDATLVEIRRPAGAKVSVERIAQVHGPSALD